jgi:uncharacterized glyoxalase superfamily protein PhnB
MTNPTRSTIMPTLRYRDARTAIDWLCNVLGFTRHAVYDGPNNTVGHAELALNGGMIMLGSHKDDDYGSREFSIKDPEGHSWSVGTYDPWASQT